MLLQYLLLQQQEQQQWILVLPCTRSKGCCYTPAVDSLVSWLVRRVQTLGHTAVDGNTEHAQARGNTQSWLSSDVRRFWYFLPSILGWTDIFCDCIYKLACEHPKPPRTTRTNRTPCSKEVRALDEALWVEISTTTWSLPFTRVAFHWFVEAWYGVPT